ncbi:HEPN domain-containing protein [Alkalimonas sp. MEB108]|uniref:HEPN domain-containing protein n=1 Tax=Alkalimonas cellulosilytica TaxID=3058395 RepID=A0ABU7JAR3_9GAMM|nr:hypothetical protein [Alkalimonas sp. MEB108]MEE2003363.1 HEPN domain-containing protein [Alkalimonas sp. MEB108]
MPVKELSYEELKTRHREERAFYPLNLSLRVHRALSWLQKAEQARVAKDHDAEFIFYWISFNAAYANEFADGERMAEEQSFQAFLGKIADLDTANQLYDLIWQQFSSSIRLLMDNRYVYRPFWDFQRGRLSEDEWLQSFKASKAALNKALAEKNVPLALGCIFTRLYTLRNQLIHGGATHNSSVNREQLKDACNLLQHLIPLIIALMMSAHQQLWGEAIYTVL